MRPVGGADVATAPSQRWGGALRQFRWLSGPAPPFAHDLRRRGWTLCDPACTTCPALLDDLHAAAHVLGAIDRAAIVLIGVEDTYMRAHALGRGFAEVVGADLALGELEQRVLRAARAMHAVPVRRRHGALELDLVLRDGLIGGKRLALHPREFDLLWRLAQSPGEAVASGELLAEVWRVNFRPETNSLAVHVCRLRAKLAAAGLGGIISTLPGGRYALTQPPRLPARPDRPIHAATAPLE